MTLRSRRTDRGDSRDIEPSSPGLGSFLQSKQVNLFIATKSARRVAGVRWTPLTKSEATTEPVGETSNPRGFDTRRGNKITKEVSIGYLLKNKSARRGSNPRPPPWQGGAPPLSHSRKSYVCVTRKK